MERESKPARLTGKNCAAVNTKTCCCLKKERHDNANRDADESRRIKLSHPLTSCRRSLCPGLPLFRFSRYSFLQPRRILRRIRNGATSDVREGSERMKSALFQTHNVLGANSADG